MMCATDFEERLFGLVSKTSTELPEDVVQALEKAASREDQGTPAAAVLSSIRENLRLAKARQLPLCQDTGTIHFFIKASDDFPRRQFRIAAEAAVVRATRAGLLRQNCVESISGRNTGNNLGHVSPVFHWLEDEVGCGGRRVAEVTLLLKGGGSENVGVQYSLPDKGLGAGRDLDGVRRCILDAVLQAQGRGCSPGVLGVAVGGDRAGGCEEAKLQLLRRFGVRSKDQALAELEERSLREANALGIGPMGFGGRNTLLELFIGARTRHPASFFVTIAYNCWCLRRQSILLEY